MDAVVWQIGDYSLYSAEPPSPLQSRLAEGVDIMRSAAAGSWHLLLKAGARGMTSVFRRSWVTRVAAELGVPICRQVCPDFTIALSLASLGARNIYIQHVGAVFLPNAHGNAMLCLLNADQVAIRRQFEVPELDMLPVGYLTAVNHIYHDIISMNNLLPSSRKIPVNWEMYFVNLIHEAVNADDMGGFGPIRRKELLCAIHARSIKLRLSLLKTILVQETTNLIQGRRKFTYQLRRMMRLLYFPATGLIVGEKN